MSFSSKNCFVDSSFLLSPSSSHYHSPWALHLNEYPFCCHDMCMHICAWVHMYMLQAWMCMSAQLCCVCMYTTVPCESLCVYMCVYVYIFAFCYPFLPEYLCLLSLTYLSVFLKHMVKDSLTGPNILNMLKADFALSSSLSLGKLLDYIPKASTQNLFLYLTTVSFL